MVINRTDILCLCTPHGVGGAQNNAARLTKAFRERGYKAELGFLCEREPEYRHLIDDFFVVYHKYPSSIMEWLEFLRSCKKQIGSRRPQVTLGFHPLANIIGAIFAGSQGTFLSRQAWPAHEQSRGTEKVESLLIRTPLIYKNIACSKFVASSFTHRGAIYQDKTSIIYNEPPKLPSTSESSVECRAHFGMSPKAKLPILGALGRLHEQKNFQLAIHALSRAPGFELYIAGGGPQESMLKSLANELQVNDRVHFLGPLKGVDVTRFLKAVDLLLMTSIYEGHPLVMLEAMSSGTPVLAHDIEVMREAGGDAAMYATSDPDSWASQILSFDESKYSRHKQLGHLRADTFSQIPMVEQYLKEMNLAPYKV
ncbi:glycosyltransferase [Hydrocarboniphaga effusa]|jgi:glycosyltransferase involved in cell wall biosynthesis|uniref:glycosyltransferase n=1 Tax=Hydrocarboniphaga effusa TaxID=243629 RepID=UPI003BACE04C